MVVVDFGSWFGGCGREKIQRLRRKERENNK